jgi:methanogenic corrinoid protein MtbC1
MIKANAEAASMLNQHASDISAAACKHLFATTPELISKPNTGIESVWSQHFSQRVTELSTAIAAGEPSLFASRVSWSGEAMLARGQDANLIRNTLQSLKYALIEVLHDNLGMEVMSVIEHAGQELVEQAYEQTTSALNPETSNGKIALQYLLAALEGHSRKAIDLIFNELQKSSDPKEVILGILMPAQREVGRLWHLGEVTVAEEHQVTATTQRCMALISDRSAHAPANGYTAVCASVAGNVHELGIRAIAYLLEMDGWKTIYLGADVPPYDLPVTAEFYDADIMLLSLALSSQLSAMRTAITTTRQQQPDLKILVGGSAFAETTGLWRKIGADGYAPNGEQAVVLANELVAPL